MTTARKRLVLTVGNPQRVAVTTDDKGRVAEIERLVYDTIPLLQLVAIRQPLYEGRAEWVADVDNHGHERYDERQRKVMEDALYLEGIREAILRNQRATRVLAIRLSPGVRETLYSRYGLDYSETTGDTGPDLAKQWAVVVELCSDPCPF